MKEKFINIFLLILYMLLLLSFFLTVPKTTIQYSHLRTLMFSFGILGIWRYSWWMLHVVRSFIYGKYIFPTRRHLANNLWASGWRPTRLYFMMTTFNEIPSTTETTLQSILDECYTVNVPVKLFIGIGSDFDEKVINNFFKNKSILIPFEIQCVRQKHPGKRYAIGETLRAIINAGLTENDPVIFMDGDTYFLPGCLSKTLPFFNLYPNMQALTTYEKAIVLNGPWWMKKWLDMRFTQRDFTMHSYSLSNKVLTLTGRMSIFRGRHLLEPGFIQIIENDYLEHWLWGKFRFLSGDDKSTWYYLLSKGADMLYIPDATTITIENIQGSALNRMKENLRRWNGNTLRNGARAIALGPKTVGFFIWICLLDQRCAIWTMFIGHLIAILLCFVKSAIFLLVAIMWIAFSRLCMSCVLFYYGKKIEMSIPIFLYLNQLMSTLIKIYILFRLPKQKWKNRGDQELGFSGDKNSVIKNWIADYLMTFYCVLFFILVLLYLNIVPLPTFSDIVFMFHNPK